MATTLRQMLGKDVRNIADQLHDTVKKNKALFTPQEYIDAAEVVNGTHALARKLEREVENNNGR